MSCFQFEDVLRQQGLQTARAIADWICRVQSPWDELEPAPGHLPFSIDRTDGRVPAPSWSYAFATMGLAGAHQAFGDTGYKTAALRLAAVLKSYQITDPFHQKDCGAIREHSPLCPWCYTRDAVSGGWGLIELYRFTGDKEYLDRARLFGAWLIKRGLDEEGYPWFGVQLDPPFHPGDPEHIENDVQGNFQGGSLNFFYQLHRATGEASWLDYMRPIADLFADHVQQDSGFFVSVFRDTKQPVTPDDAYTKLHRGNDDLGTLGLLCAYRVTQDDKYRRAIGKFLDAVWAGQRDDGSFEDSVAATPVVLNATFEARGLVTPASLTPQKVQLAVQSMLDAQCRGDHNPAMRGALLEDTARRDQVTLRANGYALILLLKLFGGIDSYLCG